MRVLLAEDDASLRKGLALALHEAGHQVLAVEDGLHADVLLNTESFDLLVLDLGLPGLDGLEVLQRLRQRRQTLPVLILSARDRTQDRVHGLDRGADDYMIKPFELSEFEARVRALLRRGQGGTLYLGRLSWAWEARRLCCGEDEVVLSRQELSLFEALVQRPGHTVSKSSLAALLGAGEDMAADNLVEVYIHRLRRKLSDAAVVIRTVRGIGYRLQEIQE